MSEGPAVYNPTHYPEGSKKADDYLANTRTYSGNDPRTQGKAGSGDVVHHPSHYTFGKYEVVDVLHDWQLAYPLDNVVKYVARAGKKGGPDKEIEDLKKAQFYLAYRIDQLEKTRSDNLTC